jgi:hypothetical protein
MGQYLDAWWGDWSSVEVVASVELFPSRQFGVDSGASEKVKGEFCLGNRFVPKVHRELVVHAPPSGGEVVFGCADGAFSCVASVVMGRGQLKLNFVHLEVTFEFLGAFVVQAMKLWSTASIDEGFVNVGDSIR